MSSGRHDSFQKGSVDLASADEALPSLGASGLIISEHDISNLLYDRDSPFVEAPGKRLFDPKVSHSLDVQQYVEKRIPRRIIHEAVNEGWDVEIYSGLPLHVMGHLKAEGFTRINRIAGQLDSFERLIATNPTTGQKKLVLQTLPGEDHRIQIEGAIHLYLDAELGAVSQEKIKVFRQEVDLRKVYTQVLSTHGIQPDTVVLCSDGDLDTLWRIPTDAKRVRKDERKDPYLGRMVVIRYTTAQGENHTMLGVRILDVFGDRASAFTHAALDAGATRFIAAGTGGGLSDVVKHNDILVPFHFNGANHKRKVTRVANRAVDTLQPLGDPTIQLSGSHASLQTPLQETKAVVDRLRDRGHESVDCEMSKIARVISSRALAEQVAFYAYVKVSDVPGTQQDLGSRPKGDPFKARMKRIFEETLGEELHSAQLLEPLPYVSFTHKKNAEKTVSTVLGIGEKRISMRFARETDGPFTKIEEQAIGAYMACFRDAVIAAYPNVAHVNPDDFPRLRDLRYDIEASFGVRIYVE